MSRIFWLRSSVFFWLFLSGSHLYSQANQKAIEYNNYIIEIQNDIIVESLGYMSHAVHAANQEAVEKKRRQLLDQIDEAIRKVNRMPSFEGSSRLKNQTLDVFYLYRSIYNTDLMELLSKKKQYSDSYRALEAYLEAEAAIDIKMNRAVEQLANAQSAFAKQNNLVVKPSGISEMEQQVQDITMLSTYTRLVFLEYFKVSWKFQDLIEVIPEKNSRQINRKREDVIEASKEALRTLRSMKPFKKETDYMDKTIALIEYFYGLSRKEFARIAQIMEKESMSESDANYINEVFDQYNIKIQEMVYDWNQANQQLWQRNIPELESIN